MNYGALDGAYWMRQTERVVALRNKINASQAPTLGRTVPEDDDLAIGENR